MRKPKVPKPQIGWLYIVGWLCTLRWEPALLFALLSFPLLHSESNQVNFSSSRFKLVHHDKVLSDILVLTKVASYTRHRGEDGRVQNIQWQRPPPYQGTQKLILFQTFCSREQFLCLKWFVGLLKSERIDGSIKYQSTSQRQLFIEFFYWHNPLSSVCLQLLVENYDMSQSKIIP